MSATSVAEPVLGLDPGAASRTDHHDLPFAHAQVAILRGVVTVISSDLGDVYQCHDARVRVGNH